MEPIRLWRVRDQLGALSWITALPAVHEQAWRDLIESEWVASPRADFDALAAEAADARTLRAERDSLVKERDEARERADGNFASYRRAVESLSAATARADKAEALLMEARGWLAALLKVGADKPAVDALRARIDALLEKPNG